MWPFWSGAVLDLQGRCGSEWGPSGVGPLWICKAVVDLSVALLAVMDCGLYGLWPLWSGAFMD